jgi:hypothetical protein
MRFRFLEATDPLWTQTLAHVPHDVYHRPEWALGFESADGGRAGAVFVEDGERRLLVPLVRRQLDDGEWDATSPYGYASPVVSHGAGTDFTNAALETAIEALGGAGCVAWFVRMHPLLELPGPIHLGTMIDHGLTVSIDLQLPEEQLNAQMRKGHRYDINRARRSGIVVHRDDHGEHLEAFVDIYHDTMRRVGARAYYYFSAADVRRQKRLLGSQMQLWVAFDGSEAIGASLFLTASSTGFVQYHLSGATERGQRHQPAKLIIDEVQRWGKDAGYRRLHLGGGLGAEEDSLFQFKAGFSPETHTFKSWRAVLRPTSYAQRCAKAGLSVRSGIGFFPAYRGNPGEEQT